MKHHDYCEYEKNGIPMTWACNACKIIQNEKLLSPPVNKMPIAIAPDLTIEFPYKKESKDDYIILDYAKPVCRNFKAVSRRGYDKKCCCCCRCCC